MWKWKHAVRWGSQFHTARTAVITLPLGVLQAPSTGAAIRFVPDVPAKRVVWEQLRTGQVVKLVILFRERFWADRGYRDLAFLHTPQEVFLTWWTAIPSEAPLLTGWSGGPRAARLAGLDPAAILDIGLSSLAQAFQLSRSVLSASVEKWMVVDWQSDPYSCGAYSYIPAGGSHLPQQLAAPLESTLFFAGEATHPLLTGTVAGAIASGNRAAAELLTALS